MSDRDEKPMHRDETVEGTTFKAEHEGEMETHTVVRVLEDELLTAREGSRYRHAWPRDILEDEYVEIIDNAE